MENLWYTKDTEKIYKHFGSQPKGLSKDKIKQNREHFGANEFDQVKPETVLSLFLGQFKGPFVLILLISAVIILYLGEYIDGGIILGIILLNAVIGSFQEGKAQDTLASLRKIVTSNATVIRDGKRILIPDTEVVAGDIVFFKDGDTIPADARLVSATGLRVNESSLTGETLVVHKDAYTKIQSKIERGDQKNMVFRGTLVMGGFGQAIVVGVGKGTVIGQVAQGLDVLEKDVPLKKNIRNLSFLILWIVGIVSALLFIVGVLGGKTVTEMFIVVVAIAISAIPESLPVIVTLVLATGVWRMSKQNALVKRLQAVEALGQANVLALDKTGTITKNQMTVEKIVIGSREYDVTGSGYNPVGSIMYQGQEVTVDNDQGLRFASYVSTFTAVADIAYDEKKEEWMRVTGDPTEVALLVFGEKNGMNRGSMLEQFPQELEIPFDLHTKHHTTVNTIDGESFMTTAGSNEVLLGQSVKYFDAGEVHDMTDTEKNRIRKQMNKLSEQGFRILALGYNPKAPKDIDAHALPGLIFLGFVAIRDAIRPEVFEALKSVREAGLKPVMITGDRPETAQAIAEEVGIFHTGDAILTGRELETLSADELSNKLQSVTIFARVEPEQKLKIVEMFKKHGDTIAMTGDGINDALSLVAADLGVAMGKIGTEVAKDAADIVLLDDNFGTITKAIEEGRSIYNTIRRSVAHLLSTNTGELLVIATAVLLGLPLPLFPTQIIWLNMVTDTFLVTAMALEPKEEGILKQKRRKPTKYIIDKVMAVRIVVVGGVMTVATLILFTQYLPEGIEKATTVSLTLLTVFQWFNIFNVRSYDKSVFSKGLFRNKYLIGSLMLVIILQLFAVYAPVMNTLLHTAPLMLKDWILIISVGLIIVAVEEIRKFIVFGRK